jgi:hypothetical protein
MYVTLFSFYPLKIIAAKVIQKDEKEEYLSKYFKEWHILGR